MPITLVMDLTKASDSQDLPGISGIVENFVCENVATLMINFEGQYMRLLMVWLFMSDAPLPSRSGGNQLNWGKVSNDLLWKLDGLFGRVAIAVYLYINQLRLVFLSSARNFAVDSLRALWAVSISH